MSESLFQLPPACGIVVPLTEPFATPLQNSILGGRGMEQQESLQRATTCTSFISTVKVNCSVLTFVCCVLSVVVFCDGEGSSRFKHALGMHFMGFATASF